MNRATELKPEDAPASTSRGIIVLSFAMPSVGVSPYALHTLEEACDSLRAKLGDALPSYFTEAINAQIEAAHIRFFASLKKNVPEGEEWWELPPPPNHDELMEFLDEESKNEPAITVDVVSEGPDYFIKIRPKD